MKKIVFVVGARPNFIKVAPLLKEFSKYKNLELILIHTGQHYSDNMSKYFFQDLGIKEPDINFNIGPDTQI
ncbi:UDP-N-acetylglucosamine 2-epimerase, partial [Candidatus Woesearchaeota archaeon]|nr:UDP-N-acetylglucosamine 2-epimerase [Candidatus Woesearchaeota archaeon]